jgi:hypothetical protein
MRVNMKLDPITECLLKKLKEDEFDNIAARSTPGTRSTVVSGSPADIAARKAAFEKQRAQWNKGKK